MPISIPQHSKIYPGDVLSVISSWQDACVDTICTSPPYWGTRECFTSSPEEIGLEQTPEEHIERVANIFIALKRILKPTGSLFLNYGDTYMQTGNKPRSPASFPHFLLQPTSLCMIPERIAWKLIEAGYILRNKIIYAKRTPRPYSGQSRFTCRWEYLFFFTKSQGAEAFFDLDAVRVPHKSAKKPPKDKSKLKKRSEVIKSLGLGGSKGHPGLQYGSGRVRYGAGLAKHYPPHCPGNPRGKNPGDVMDETDLWWISLEPISDFPHFSVFPTQLCRVPILATCPEKVCNACGVPFRKEYVTEGGFTDDWEPIISEYFWIPSCECGGDSEAGMFLDPFCGSGRALIEADRLGRRWCGIEICESLVDYAYKAVQKDRERWQGRITRL